MTPPPVTPSPAPTPPTAAGQGPSQARVLLTGAVALAVAMGIGRFAFTPLLPLMMRDGVLDAATGAEWAAANYTGYLAGALLAARLGRRPLALLRGALAGVVLATMAGGVVEARLAGATLRFAAGVFSAWVMVGASTWCLGELARAGAASRGAFIYGGVGVGIVLAGLLAWLGGGQPAAALWVELGLTAALGMAVVMAVVKGRRDEPAAPARAAAPERANALPAAAASDGVRRTDPAPGRATARSEVGSTGRVPGVPSHPRGRTAGLVLAYAVFGCGYIVPATFLPAMAREQVPDPRVFGLTWPVFGAAAALSVVFAARRLAGWPRQRVWAVAQAAMALGTAVPLVDRSLWALALSAVLVGGTFMVATMAGLQLAREQRPHDPAPLVARMTAAFAFGQIAGPLLVRAFAGTAGFGALASGGLAWPSLIAALLLALSAAWLAASVPRG